MNILPLCGKLSLDICDFERRKRMWQTGLAQAMRLSPPSNDFRKIIATRLLEPVVRELGRKTGQDIRYRALSRDTSFHLLCKGREFAIISLPNPSTGRVFIVHPISERKREAGLPAERAAEYGRNQFVPPGAVSQNDIPRLRAGG